MIQSEHIIRLDMHSGLYQRDVSITRNDTCRTLVIKLYENGKSYIIPENCRAQFVARKKDNTSVFNDCAIEDNCIVYELTVQTTAAAGVVYCEIRLIDENDELITSPKFSLFVEPSVFVDGNVEESSKDEIDALSNLLTTLEDSYKNGKFNGAPGVGIEKIEQIVDENSAETIIRITLEDDTFTDVTIKNDSLSILGNKAMVLPVPTLAQGATDYTSADKAAVMSVITAIANAENPVVMLRTDTALIPAAYFKQGATHFFVGISPDSLPGDSGEIWLTYVKFNPNRDELTVDEHANAGDSGDWLEDIADLENDLHIATNNLVFRAITLALENLEGGAVQSVNGKTGAVTLTASDVGALPDTTVIPTRASQVGADATGTAQSLVTAHNFSNSAHNDIRLLIEGLATRLNALCDSDDTTLDQLSEIVAYIKANKSLIDSITTSKVNVSDIIDNLTTSSADKPLSAGQGVALKALIDAITVPTKLSQLSGDSSNRTVTDAEKSAWNAKSNFSGEYADLSGKPTIPQHYNDLGLISEIWEFELEDGSIVRKNVAVSAKADPI